MPSESSPLAPDRSRRQQSRSSLELFSTSTEELGLSSPPYRPVNSSSSHEEDLLLPSPAYYPPADSMPEQEKNLSTSSAPEPSYEASRPRPTVHYSDDHENLSNPTPGYARSETLNLISSRPSSIATDDEETDDYDWSAEEDLVEEEAKFVERMGVSKSKGKKAWGIKRIITFLSSSLIGSTFLAGILIIPGVIVQLYWYKPHPTENRLYVKDNIQAWLFWAASNLVISWYLAMVIDVIPVIVQYFISAAWGHVSEYVKTRIEIYDSLKNNVKPLLYASSGWISWIIIFENIYNLHDPDDETTSRAAYTDRLQQVVEFFFFFALVICVKQMLSHTLAFFFHRTAYRDRIDSVQEALKVIETLRQYRPKHAKKSSGNRTPVFGSISSPISDKDHHHSLNSALRSATPPTSPPATHSKLRQSFYDWDDNDADNEDPDRTLVDSSKKGKKKIISWMHTSKKNTKPNGQHDVELSDLHRFEHEIEAVPQSSRPTSPVNVYHPESSSAHRYPPTPISAEGHGSESTTLAHAAQVLKNAVLHDARNLKGHNIGEGSMAWNVSSTKEAKRLARAIYMRFKDRGRNYLMSSDFHPAFPSEEAAKAAFHVFDRDDNGDISRAEIKTRLVRVYKERRFLSRSMRDVGAALKTLDQILLLFAMVILFFISLSVFGVNITSSLTSMYSLIIAASFFFKNAASSAFDSIMFLFVTHPYDTGDRCFIDLEILVVKKVGLFATIFTRSDGSETYYFNSQLFTKFITNVRRSGKMSENLTMQVAWRTPLEKIDLLEKLLNEWLSTEENRWYAPSTSISLQHIEYQRYMILTIGIPHNGSRILHFIIQQDWDLRNKRKTAFHAAVQYYCRQLSISFFESPIPIVHADSETKIYTPDVPSPPTSPIFAEHPPSPLNVGQDPNAESMKPFLGFLPPLATRSAHLRARRSKSKKAAMRGMDADAD